MEGDALFLDEAEGVLDAAGLDLLDAAGQPRLIDLVFGEAMFGQRRGPK